MPVTGWNIVDKGGKKWLVIDLAQFHVPLEWDPNSNMFFCAAAPSAGFSAAFGNFPALMKGDPGPAPSIQEGIDFTPLAYGDETPDFARLVEVSPATDLTGPVYQLVMGLHLGPKGDDGTTSIDMDSIEGTPLAKKMIQVNVTGDGFEFVSPKVGDRYVPATLNSIASGNATATLAVVSVPVQNVDWRPEAIGHTIITPTGPNLRVDLMARLAGETNGNIVARCHGIAGIAERQHLSSMPPAGSADDYDKVLAGAGPTTVHLRVERQSGDQTFTTSASTTVFGVRVHPIP